MALCTSYTNQNFQDDDPQKEKGFNVPKVKLPSDVLRLPAENHVTLALNQKGQEKDSTILEISENVQNSSDQLEDYSLLSYFPCWRNLMKHENVDMANKVSKWKKFFVKVAKSILIILFLAYFTAVLLLQNSSAKKAENRWCDGDGMLIILTSILLTGLFYYKVLKPYIGNAVYKWMKRKCLDSQSLQILLTHKDKWFVSASLYTLALASFGLFLIIDTEGDRIRLISAAGILILCLFGFLFSIAPRKIVWRPVIWGIGLQYMMGFIVIRSQIGRATFQCIGDKVSAFLDFTDPGTEFVFGSKLLGMKILALDILCVILFFTFSIEILYHYGAMQWIVIKLGWLLEVTIGTTPCESVNAVSNIFLGPAAAPLIIRPYITAMTKSELHAIMTSSFASIASGIMAIYISFGISAAHMLSASVMSAPAALACSKLFYPETEVSKTRASSIKIIKGDKVNALHAAIEGVISSIPIAANALATLVAIISFIAFLDAIFNWACVLVNVEDGTCTLSNISGYLFMPLAWIMGIPWNDCYYVGQLLGTKTILNEFLGYIKLTDYAKEKYISKRSEIIATYALCGFSNIGAIGIQVGSLKAMAPRKMRDIATLAFRAMIAGSIACFMTACVAGTLITEDVQIEIGNQNATF